MTAFFSVLDVPVEGKAEALLKAVRGQGPRKEVAPASFMNVPGSPFAYWTSEKVRSLYASCEAFEGAHRSVRQGGVTGNDKRYLRLHWEVPPGPRTNSEREWVPFAKGGKLSPWYSSYPVVVRWDRQRTTFHGFTGLLHRPSEKPSSADHYFKPALTWPLRASRFAPVPLPHGCVFSIRGYAILAPEKDLLGLAGLCNAQAFDYLFKVALGRFGYPEFVVGVLQKLPFPQATAEEMEALAQFASRAWTLKRAADTINETSRAFLLPLSVNERVTGLNSSAVARELDEIQREIDGLVFSLFGIDAEERAAIDAFSMRAASTGISKQECGEEVGGDFEEEEEAISATAMEGLRSWLVGVAFGRFDIRLATGERKPPSTPKPFDALPFRSPGSLPETEEPLRPLGILVDDEGHSDDLYARACAAADIADVSPGEGLREWLAQHFFSLHNKMYSSSGRKAPIYWQFAVPSLTYSVWVYIHAFSSDTIFRVQNDYVAPKLAYERRQLERLRSELNEDASRAERRAVEVQEDFVQELQTFHDEVRRVAPLWNPDLDDGVILNHAVLWRLVPQSRSWQKDLKATWQDLCAGKFDWSHLAMRLWPERVVPKCATDRSLAIAHGLEDVFWAEDESGKWKCRAAPMRPEKELVDERTSDAVKAALKDLLEAPEPAGTARRTRRKA